MAEHNDTGASGEQMAVEHLRKSGYSILERNWYYGREEVDIIAKHGDALVIVEVKTRSTAFFGPPHEQVSRSKQNHLIRAAHAYVDRNDLDLEVRFDIIGIVMGNQIELHHVEGAFLPRW